MQDHRCGKEKKQNQYHLGKEPVNREEGSGEKMGNGRARMKTDERASTQKEARAWGSGGGLDRRPNTGMGRALNVDGRQAGHRARRESAEKSGI